MRETLFENENWVLQKSDDKKVMTVSYFEENHFREDLTISYDDLRKWIAQDKKLENELTIYKVAIGDIEHAMHKVGWTNSRIEDAFGEMNERLKAL